jgi:hypothetical protein
VHLWWDHEKGDYVMSNSTTVSGTVTDSGSQTWNNGSIQFSFVPVSGLSGPYEWTGGAFNPNTVYTAALNGSGAYSVSIPSNDAITPAGTSWAIRATPEGAGQAFVDSVILSGPTQTKNVIPPAITVPPGQATAVYSTAEIAGAQIGSLAYVIGTGLENCTSGGSSPTWTPVGGGGSSTTTIASGTATLGTSLIASGAKASTVTVSATGVLTTDNIIADFNADPTGVVGFQPSASGMLTIIKFPTSNNVNFIVVNNTGGSITPGAITLNWRVVR